MITTNPIEQAVADWHEELLAGLANEAAHSRFLTASGSTVRWTYDGAGHMLKNNGGEMVIYRFFLNQEKDPQGRNVGFFGYGAGHKLEFVYAGKLDEVADADPEWYCNALFRTFNIDHPADYRNRSMSVGDVIALQFGEQMVAFACESCGWKQVEPITVEIS